jgi:hypothetical protein
VFGTMYIAKFSLYSKDKNTFIYSDRDLVVSREVVSKDQITVSGELACHTDRIVYRDFACVWNKGILQEFSVCCFPGKSTFLGYH